MELTAKKLAANRQHAQLSTGPTSPEGKAITAQNARTHGLLARDPVITDGDGAEDPAEFDALRADLYAEFTPQTAIERALVERIASGLWRLRRAQRHEVGAIRQSLDECRRESAQPYDDQLRALSNRLTRLSADRNQDAKFLASLQSAPDLTSPKVLEQLSLAAKDVCPHADQGDPSRLLAGVTTAMTSEIQRQDTALTNLRAEIASVERYRKLALDRRPLIANLPPDANLTNLLRYESMVDRQIHRALAELRRRRRSAASTVPSRAPRRHLPLQAEDEDP